MLSIDGDIIADEGAAPWLLPYTWDSVSDDFSVCSEDNSDFTLDSVDPIPFKGLPAQLLHFSPECGNVVTDNNHAVHPMVTNGLKALKVILEA